MSSHVTSVTCHHISHITISSHGITCHIVDYYPIPQYQGSLGGGVIQTTASESTFVCLLAGRTEAIKRYQVTLPHVYRYRDIASFLKRLCLMFTLPMFVT